MWPSPGAHGRRTSTGPGPISLKKSTNRGLLQSFKTNGSSCFDILQEQSPCRTINIHKTRENPDGIPVFTKEQKLHIIGLVRSLESWRCFVKAFLISRLGRVIRSGWLDHRSAALFRELWAAELQLCLCTAALPKSCFGMSLLSVKHHETC